MHKVVEDTCEIISDTCGISEKESDVFGRYTLWCSWIHDQLCNHGVFQFFQHQTPLSRHTQEPSLYRAFGLFCLLASSVFYAHGTVSSSMITSHLVSDTRLISVKSVTWVYQSWIFGKLELVHFQLPDVCSQYTIWDWTKNLMDCIIDQAERTPWDLPPCRSITTLLLAWSLSSPAHTTSAWNSPCLVHYFSKALRWYSAQPCLIQPRLCSWPYELYEVLSSSLSPTFMPLCETFGLLDSLDYKGSPKNLRKWWLFLNLLTVESGWCSPAGAIRNMMGFCVDKSKLWTSLVDLMCPLQPARRWSHDLNG